MRKIDKYDAKQPGLGTVFWKVVSTKCRSGCAKKQYKDLILGGHDPRRFGSCSLQRILHRGTQPGKFVRHSIHSSDILLDKTSRQGS